MTAAEHVSFQRPDRLADLDGPEDEALIDLDADDVQPSPVDMVVFDIGNVLWHWEPRAALVAALGEDGADAFLADADVDFPRRNLEADGGRAWDEIVAELEAEHPQHAAGMRAYVENFAAAISRPVEGVLTILTELDEAGVPLFAVTNFSAELFEVARQLHADVLDRFEEIVVSGEEGVCKPDPEVWEILEEVTRHRGGANDTVFIDDSPANVMSAEAAGLDGIVFTDTASLRDELRLRGLPLRALPAHTDAS